jgi:hypothetical protein
MEEINLSLYLKDLGFGATYSSNVIFTVFEQLSIYPVNASQRLTDQEISQCLAMMSLNQSGNNTLISILGIINLKRWNFGRKAERIDTTNENLERRTILSLGL